MRGHDEGDRSLSDPLPVRVMTIILGIMFAIVNINALRVLWIGAYDVDIIILMWSYVTCIYMLFALTVPLLMNAMGYNNERLIFWLTLYGCIAFLIAFVTTLIYFICAYFKVRLIFRTIAAVAFLSIASTSSLVTGSPVGTTFVNTTVPVFVTR